MIKLLLVDKDYVMSDGVGGEILLDLNDGTDYTYMLNTFKPRPADQRQSLSDSPFKDGTTYRPGLGKLEDVVLPFSIKVIGDEITSAKDKVDVVLNEARRDTVYVVYAPDYVSPITFYSAHPAVSLDTDTFWFREYQNANLAVVDFDLLAGCGFGTVETLTLIQNLAPNPSFDRWSYVTDRVMSMDGTTAIKDIITDTAFTMAGTPTTAALLGAIAPVISAAAYTSCKIPTATIGLTPGEDISLMFVVNTSWAGGDEVGHELFCSIGDGNNGFRISYFYVGELCVQIQDADGDTKEKYMAVDATNWAANTDHIILVTVTADDIQRLFLDGVEATGSSSYGTPVRESALDTNLYVGVYYDGDLAFALDGKILCAVWDRILTDAEIKVLSGLTNWANAPDDWTVKTGGISTITEEEGIFLYGSVSAKFVRNGGDCEMQTTGYIKVDPDDPFYLDGYTRSASALDFTLEALCYDSNHAYLDSVTLDYETKNNSVWMRHTMYKYHVTGTRYYIAPGDWPEGTAYVRLRASLDENGTAYLDSVIFGDVKYIPDYAIDGVVGLRIPPGEAKGDLPALCTLHVSNLLFDPGWRAQDSGGTEDINGVDAFNGDHVYAVGDEGGVFFYNGVLWVTQDSGVSVPLNAVSAFDSTRIWAVGNGGTIRFSDDSSTWSGQTCPIIADLMGVFAISATNIVAVGDGGLIVKSANGTTWAQKTSGTTNRLNAVHADAANRIYAVGDNGTILTSADGTTWTIRTSGTTKNLYGVYALDATHVWAVGQDGTILFSADAGATWTRQPSPVSESLHGVWAADDSCVWISGDRGKILFGSSLWEVQTEESRENLNGVSGFDEINVWAVGAGGTILKGVYPGGALGITDLIIGQGVYHEDYDPVVECGEGDLAYDPYRRWGSYRVLDADEFNDFLFNLASYAGGSYAIAAGLTFSASTAYDKGTIRKSLQTPTGMDITAQYLEDEIDLGDPNTKWKEVLLQDDMWDDIPVPTHVISDDAGLGNINQVVEVRAHTSLGAVKEWLDYLGLMPTDRFVNIGAIDTGCLIIDSVMGVVFDSLLGGPSTAMVHDPTESPDTPRFFMDPVEGVNMTLVAINDVSDDQRVGMVNLNIRYRPRYKLYAS